MFGIASRRRLRRCQGILVQETHGHVEGRAAPHFQAEQVVQPVRDEVRDGQHVVGADTRGQQRLVRVAEGGVGDQQALLPAGPFGEVLGAQPLQNLARAIRRRGGVVARHRRRPDAARRKLTPDGRIAVDDDVAEIGQQLGGAVAARRELEQLGRLVQPARGHVPRLEYRMVDDVFEERDVGLHAADAELAQARSMRWQALAEFAAPGGDLHQQRIVVTA